MTRIKNRVLIIELEEPNICEYCGKTAELRPYGKNGVRICFSCGMANRKETDTNYLEAIKDVITIVVPEQIN